MASILVNAVDDLKLSYSEKANLKTWIRDCKSLKMLATGITGVGNSTLIDALIGDKVTSYLRSEGRSIMKYSKYVEEIEVVVWNSSGLQGGRVDEDTYIAELKVECSRVDIVLYTVDISSSPERECSLIRKLAGTFRAEWWKNVVVILTSAQYYGERLDTRVKQWKSRVRRVIYEECRSDIVEKISFVLAGDFQRTHLPGHDFWFSELFGTVATHVKRPAKPALFVANARRFQMSTSAVNVKHISVESHLHPLFADVVSTTVMAVIGALTGAVVGLGAGATIGALIGIVGGPVGVVVGAVVGGAIGTIAGGIAGFLAGGASAKKYSLSKTTQIQIVTATLHHLYIAAL